MKSPLEALLRQLITNIAVGLPSIPNRFRRYREGVRRRMNHYRRGLECDPGLRRRHLQGSFQPLREAMQSFVSNGGQVWACDAGAKPRGITDADLVEGARIVTAARAVEYLASGASSFSF